MGGATVGHLDVQRSPEERWLALDLVDRPREEYPITFLTCPREGERAAECLASVLRLRGIDFEETTALGDSGDLAQRRSPLGAR
jgi:hypothetical protein